MSRYLLIVLLVAVFGAMAAPGLALDGPRVVAQEETEGEATEEGEVTEEGAAEEETPVPEPAIPAEEAASSPEEPAWTYKFLVPTAVLVSVLVVVAIIVGYFVKVTRSRYRVVE